MLSRETFIDEIEDFDEDDCRTLPSQNQKLLENIIKAIKSGEAMPTFTKQKIGSYGDDIIQAIFMQQYQDLQDILLLIQQCCFCQGKFYKHILKAGKEALNVMSIQIQEGSYDYLNERKRLFQLIIGLAQTGVDGKLQLLKTAFPYFLKNLTDVAKKVETLGEVSKDTLQFDGLNQFFITSQEVVTDLFDQHLDGLLFKISQDKLFDIANTTMVMNPVQDVGILHLKDVNKTLNILFTTFKSLSQIFDKHQKQAQREKNPKKRDEILQVVKLGGEFLPIFNNFLEAAFYDKQIICSPVLTPFEELNLGNKYFPDNFEKIEILNLNVIKFDNLNELNQLCSSNASKAELSFDIPQQIFHSIRTNSSPLASDIEFMFNRTILNECFYQLFVNIKSILDLETLIHMAYTQFINNSLDIEFTFSTIINELLRKQCNPVYLAALYTTLYYNNINCYYVTYATCFESYTAQSEKELLHEYILQQLEQSKGNCSYFVIFISKVFEMRIVSSVQLGKIVCSILHKFKKAKTFSNEENRTSMQRLDLLVQIVSMNIVYFSIIDSNGLDEIRENFFEKAISNIKKHFVESRSSQLEYIYKKLKDLLDDYQCQQSIVSEAVIQKDAEILKEEQEKFDLQYMKKKKNHKSKKPYINVKKEYEVKKTRYQQKYEDLDSRMSKIILLPDNIPDDIFEEGTRDFYLGYYDAVKASYEDFTEQNQDKQTTYTSAQRTQFINQHAPDLFKTIENYTNFASLILISRLYKSILDQLDLKKVFTVYIQEIQNTQVTLKTAITWLALYMADKISISYENFGLPLMNLSFDLKKTQNPDSEVETITGIRATPNSNAPLVVRLLQKAVFISFEKNQIDQKIGNLTRFLHLSLNEDDLVENDNIIAEKGFTCKVDIDVKEAYMEVKQPHIEKVQDDDLQFLNSLMDVE